MAQKTIKYNLMSKNLKLSGSKKGINIFAANCDEIELDKYFSELIERHLIDPKFTKPRLVVKYRNFDKR